MTTCTVTHFKTHALRLLAEIAESGEELTVTRHGKPLARVGPARSCEKIELGRMAGTADITGDIVSPLGPDEWEASG